MRTTRFCFVVFGHNVQTCCHTHDSRPPWLCIPRDSAWSILNCTQQRVDRAWSSNTRLKQKGDLRVRNTNYAAALTAKADNHWFRDYSLPHLHSTPPLGGGLPSEYWYPVCVATWRWKKFEDIFIRFDTTHERDRQTERERHTHAHRHHMTA